MDAGEPTIGTTEELYAQLRRRGEVVRYPFGARPALVNVDLQQAYTAAGVFATAYTAPAALDRVNELTAAARRAGAPVVWSFVAYEPSGADCGIWGTRSDTPDSLQRITVGSSRARIDRRLEVDDERDLLLRKRMPSAFFETHLASWLRQHDVDTVVLTGGSTSGCLRATAIDALSHGYATFVAEDAVSDKHASPHYGTLYDLAAKYADIRTTEELVALLEAR